MPVLWGPCLGSGGRPHDARGRSRLRVPIGAAAEQMPQQDHVVVTVSLIGVVRPYHRERELHTPSFNKTETCFIMLHHSSPSLFHLSFQHRCFRTPKRCKTEHPMFTRMRNQGQHET